MRDLFQVVFELKKKEIEMAKQHIEQQQIKFGGGKSETSSTSKVRNTKMFNPTKYAEIIEDIL